MNVSGHLSMLPPLSAEEAAHSRAVLAYLHERIAAAGGCLPFDEFMEIALYAPGLGYYSAGSTKIGAAGDFVTAPELSDLFSQCVARQCAEVLGLTGAGSVILEYGAGTGRMAATILETLAAMGSLPERYLILEVSADLRERQRSAMERLPADLQRRVAWLDELPQSPVRGVILANEVLDALPCERFVMREGEAKGLGVAVGPDGVLVECEYELSGALAQATRQLLDELPEPLADGYRSETCLRIEPWIASAMSCLEQGIALLFDYGLPRAQFYHPQRMDGTLRCHFRQRAHDEPLINVGVQDLTAWVDFTRVAEAALAAQLEVRGFVTQTAFLLGSGIDSLAADSSDVSTRTRRAAEARQLLLPGEMGEAFKVMALARNVDDTPSGFSLQDLRVSL